MPDKNHAASSEKTTLNLSPLEIYVWALQGPFESGYVSAIAMAKVIKITRSEDTLPASESGIIAKEEKYNDNKKIWESWRKEFIRENLDTLGKKKGDVIKNIENAISEISNNDPPIQNIAKRLKVHDEEKKSPKVEPDPGDISDTGHEKYLPYHRAAYKTHIPSQQPSYRERASAEQPKDIFDKIKEKFVLATAALSVVIYAAIFLLSWGALIAGNLVLGLAFGWIPALILTFMASIFAPLVMLISGLLILSLIALLIFIIYNMLI